MSIIASMLFGLACGAIGGIVAVWVWIVVDRRAAQRWD